MRYVYNNYKIPISVYERIDAALETIGCNNIDIDSFVCVCLNDYPLTRSKVACCPDMIPIVNTFAALVQHLN